MDQNNLFDQNTLAQLQGLLGQMGPSDEDKADARKRMWLSAGLGIMANSYKPPSKPSQWNTVDPISQGARRRDV